MGFSSARLCLRELRLEDVTQSYIGWLNDPVINRYLETRYVVQDEESVRAFVASQFANPDVFLFRIALAECDTHIGNIKLGPINHTHNTAQISLLIGAQGHQGQGFATEAINAVTAWGFKSLGLSRIEGGCYADNLKSLRAFLKCGYAVEGFRRDAVIAADGVRQGAFLFAHLSGASSTGA